jgi:hypothetical protein
MRIAVGSIGVERQRAERAPDRRAHRAGIDQIGAGVAGGNACHHRAVCALHIGGARRRADAR